MITIENEQFIAGIKIKGAELASLKAKSTGQEYIWQADPGIWGGSAPILFPIIGKLKDGRTQISGSSYAIPKHGLLRTRTARPVEQGRDFAVLQFESSEETLKLYPFAFKFTATFQLLETGLAVNYEVQNSGTESMLFSIGSHPAFALDLDSRTLNDYAIEFSAPETLDLYGLKNGLMTKRKEGYLKQQTTIPLSDELFNEDALIFKHIKSRTLRLEPTGIEIDIHNNPHLGIWAKPGAPYVCIEPWYSFDDAADCDGVFKNKPGIMKLPAGESFKTGYSVRVRSS